MEIYLWAYFFAGFNMQIRYAFCEDLIDFLYEWNNNLNKKSMILGLACEWLMRNFHWEK